MPGEQRLVGLGRRCLSREGNCKVVAFVGVAGLGGLFHRFGQVEGQRAKNALGFAAKHGSGTNAERIAHNQFACVGFGFETNARGKGQSFFDALLAAADVGHILQLGGVVSDRVTALARPIMEVGSCAGQLARGRGNVSLRHGFPREAERSVSVLEGFAAGEEFAERFSELRGFKTGAIFSNERDLAAQKRGIQEARDSLRVVIHERIESDFPPAFAVKGRDFIKRQNVAFRRIAAVKVEDGSNFPGSLVGRNGYAEPRTGASTRPVGSIGCERDGLGCKDPGGLMVPMTGMHPAPVVDNDIGTERTHDADHVFDDLVAPDFLGFLGSLREAEVPCACEVKLYTVATRGGEQFLSPNKTKLWSLFGPESVLAALAACQREQGDVGVKSAGEIGQHGGAFVIRVRGDVEDAGRDACGVDSLYGLSQTGAGAGSGRKLRGRLRADHEKQDSEPYGAGWTFHETSQREIIEMLGREETFLSRESRDDRTERSKPALQRLTTDVFVREGPLSHFPGPNQKCENAEGNLEQSPFTNGTRMPEKPRPGEHREDGRKRIQPHFERKAFRGPALVEKDNADGLADELDEQAHRENSRNGRFELEGQAEQEREAA